MNFLLLSIYSTNSLLFSFFVTIQSHAKWKKNRESCLREGALFLELHMAKSNIEMQRKWNRDGALNRYLFYSKTFSDTNSSRTPLPDPAAVCPVSYAFILQCLKTSKQCLCCLSMSFRYCLMSCCQTLYCPLLYCPLLRCRLWFHLWNL